MFNITLSKFYIVMLILLKSIAIRFIETLSLRQTTKQFQQSTYNEFEDSIIHRSSPRAGII